ncbi:MAG: extracellular solute-binding protein, partial [Chloroflexi bacterium]|nr:extracellular solute-binding protein [Chloroflexota bacterium]
MAQQVTRRDLIRASLTSGALGLVGGLLAACGAAPASPTAAPKAAEPTKPAAGAATTAPVAATTAPAAAQPTVAAPAKAGEIKLVAWLTDRRSINDMTEKEAVPEYQSRNPGHKVEIQFVPEPQIPQKLLAAVAAKIAPDVTSIDETFLNQLWLAKAILPIPAKQIDVRQEMGAKVGDLYKLPYGQQQGEYYGLPNGTFGGVIYYNLDLLSQLKVTPEQIPDKWDDFFKWAKDVTVWEGNTLKRSGFAIFGSDDSLRSEYRIQKGGWFDGNLFPTKDKVALARDLEYEAAQFVLDVYDRHKTDARDGVTYQDKFGQGRAVTTFAWTWNNGFIETQYKFTNFGTKIAPQLAAGSGGPLGQAGPDVGFCGSVQSTSGPQVEAAWNLWRYFVGPDYLKRYAILRGVQPSLKSMWTMPEFSEEKGGPKWAPLARKMKPGNNLDSGFNS